MFYGRKYMLDNLNLIPGEAFTAGASVINNVLDKITGVTGYIIKPKGKREDRKEALEYLTKKIEEDPNIPVLAKAALIAERRKMLKEYCNRQDILNIAIQNLDQNADADNLDFDWLNEFFEKAGMMNDEQIKLLFGKLLAEACNGKQVSKSLIYKLFIMDKEAAEAFVELCKYSVEIKVYGEQNNLLDKETQIIYFRDRIGWEEKYPLNGNIFEMDSLGLISDSSHSVTYSNTGNSIPIKKICINYGNESLTLIGRFGFNFVEQKENIEIPVGKIYLTKDGQYLSNLIEKSNYVTSYLESIKKYYIEAGFKTE